MKKTTFAFLAVLAVLMSFMTSCSKEVTADLETGQQNCYNDYEISIDDALKTLSEFLETEGLTTKSSSLSHKDFIVEKWPLTTDTKAVASLSCSVYCVEFCDGKGSLQTFRQNSFCNRCDFYRCRS